MSGIDAALLAFQITGADMMGFAQQFGIQAKIGMAAGGIALGVLVSPGAALANVTEVGPAAITDYIVGWHVPATVVALNVPHVNPENCAPHADYITDPAMEGTTLFNAALMTAFSTSRRVTLIIDLCFGGRPKIIGVRMH